MRESEIKDLVKTAPNWIYQIHELLFEIEKMIIEKSTLLRRFLEELLI